MNRDALKHHIRNVAGCLALACLGALVALGLTACQSEPEGWNPNSNQNLYEYNLEKNSIPLNSYDYSSLESFHDYKYYLEKGEVVSQVGIDVSEHQKEVNWSKVKASGIGFCFLRAGYRGNTDGGLFTDSTFATNLEGAKAAGLDVGVYFFSQATNAQEAQEEATYLASILNGASLELPVVFDLEKGGNSSRTGNLSHEGATEAAQAFATEMDKAGYRTMVYLNKQASETLFDISQLQNCSFWYAEYGVEKPSLGFDFDIWQYTENGSVYGIDGDVDLNIMFRRS